LRYSAPPWRRIRHGEEPPLAGGVTLLPPPGASHLCSSGDRANLVGISARTRNIGIKRRLK